MFFTRQKRPRIITGIDIGTTKVCAIIGQAEPDGKLSILGVGSCPSTGLRCGEIVDIDPTVNAIVQATDRAMELASVPVGDVFVGIAGEHIESLNTRAIVEIHNPARGIDDKDRRRAIRKAQETIQVPDEKAKIHSIVQEFRVNGGSPTANPVGLSGSTLEVSAHIVLSNSDPIHNIIRCIRRAGLRNPHIVLQSLASSMSVINDTERELGAMLIDIGGGTTDVAISKGGAIRSTKEISLGGDHITRDIAQLLSASINDAENAKKRYGCALPQEVERGRTFQLPVSGDPHNMRDHSEYLLAEIIEARLEDIFRIVRDYLDASGYRDHLHSGIVLTGGTSMLPGITDVAERILDMRCRLGSPQGHRGLASVVQGPIYATAVGLLVYGKDEDDHEFGSDATVYAAPGGMGGGVRRLLDYLVESFR